MHYKTLGKVVKNMALTEDEMNTHNYHDVQIHFLATFGETKYRPLFVNEWVCCPIPIAREYKEEFEKIIDRYKQYIDFDKLSQEFTEEFKMTPDEYLRKTVDHYFIERYKK